jgi:hypothetical protein
MIFSIFLSVTLFLIYIFFTLKEKLHRQINTFLYLSLTFINITFTIIIQENFKKMDLTKIIDKYLSFLLYRNILFQLVMLFGIHFFFYFTNVYSKIIVACLTVGSLYLMTALCESLSLFKWQQWNWLWSIFYYFFLFCTAVSCVLFFRNREHSKRRTMR